MAETKNMFDIIFYNLRKTIKHTTLSHQQTQKVLNQTIDNNLRKIYPYLYFTAVSSAVHIALDLIQPKLAKSDLEHRAELAKRGTSLFDEQSRILSQNALFVVSRKFQISVFIEHMLNASS